MKFFKRDGRIATLGRQFGQWLRAPGAAFASLLSRVIRLCALGWRAQRGGAAIEFALLILPFCSMMIFIFAVGLHYFYQELLESALHVAVRQVQTGNAQNLANGSGFNSGYLCPATGNMLTCANLYVNVQKVSFSGTQDFYNYTTGTLPSSNGALNFTGFTFCNAGPSEFILYTAVYVAPSLTGSFLPNIFSVAYNGSQVDAIMSQVGTYTENFTALTATASAASSC